MKLTPIEARTFKQICSLPRDNLDTSGHWIQLDVGEVTIAKQKGGEAAKVMLTVPRAQFDRMVRWYMTGSLRRPKKRKA